MLLTFHAQLTPRFDPSPTQCQFESFRRARGAWLDNVFVERLWDSVKYEEVYPANIYLCWHNSGHGEGASDTPGRLRDVIASTYRANMTPSLNVTRAQNRDPTRLANRQSCRP
jgi:hypothetical protein